MPPPVFRFQVPAQIWPVGEMSTSLLLVVPYVYWFELTEAPPPLQVTALGCCTCWVWGWSVMEATSVSFKP
jgi:hypothetical protein